MKLPFIIITCWILCFAYSCKQSKNVVYTHDFELTKQTPALVDYYASPNIVKYSYHIKDGDTCQMALENNTIYISYEESYLGYGIIVNVVVK
tara:strand:- start:352 stop:627 length:276 start_codon:yes stop_codon:yes gene_type:complete